MSKKYTTNSGFTLIELLVVITIIGILASTVLASLNDARSAAQDSYRKQALKQLQTALELYYNSNGSYPVTSGYSGVSVNGGSRGTTGPSGYIPNLAPQYIPELPVDPLGDTSGWSGFLYYSNGRDYVILSHINGPASFPQAGDAFYDPQRPTWAWKLCSGGIFCTY